MGRQIAVVSYRLGGHDGVSVEARKWADALRTLDFEVRRVAGAIEDGGAPDDVVVPGLAIGADCDVDGAALTAALDGADLVIVDNICSLPINVDAGRAVAKAVGETRSRVVFRHHDLPWQRRNLVHLEAEFPPDVPGALHATINLRSRRELHARGYEHVVTIHNYFDLTPAPGHRDDTRRALGFGDDELVVFQPARAIERKNVPGGMRYAQRLAQMMPDVRVHYWLSGPAEDGYAETLDKLRARAATPMTIGRAATAADAYAACDAIVFPSTWEGFGNPTIESIAAHRPLAAFAYPVLAEILASGVRLFSTDTPEDLVRFLAQTEEQHATYYEVNLHRARLSFDIAELPRAIDEAFAHHGWVAW
jgi:glycosyltransferase involved in cell wall biosynthesis